MSRHRDSSAVPLQFLFAHLVTEVEVERVTVAGALHDVHTSDCWTTRSWRWFAFRIPRVRSRAAPGQIVRNNVNLAEPERSKPIHPVRSVG